MRRRRVTDLAALRCWAHPGDRPAPDHPRAVARRGRGDRRRRRRHPARARALAAGVRRPAAAGGRARRARAAATVRSCVVSGGGWGVGDLERAARAALAVPGATPVCLCGTNAALRAPGALRRRPRVRAEGFTTRMCEWLAAADVLVHSTAGLTCSRPSCAARGRSPTAGASATSASTTSAYRALRPRRGGHDARASSRARCAARWRLAAAAAGRSHGSRWRRRRPRARLTARPGAADRRRDAEHERGADDERQPAEDRRRARPVLVGHHRRQQHRDRGLERERAGRHARGADALQRAHLVREREPGDGRRRPPPTAAPTRR